jgi:hypothetical protein
MKARACARQSVGVDAIDVIRGVHLASYFRLIDRHFASLPDVLVAVLGIATQGTRRPLEGLRSRRAPDRTRRPGRGEFG